MCRNGFFSQNTEGANYLFLKLNTFNFHKIQYLF